MALSALRSSSTRRDSSSKRNSKPAWRAMFSMNSRSSSSSSNLCGPACRTCIHGYSSSGCIRILMGSRSDEKRNGRASMTTAYKFLRSVGMFLGNVGAAIIEPLFSSPELYRIFPTQTPWGVTKRNHSECPRCFLGPGVFRLLQVAVASTKWVFVVSLIWFGCEGIKFLAGRSKPPRRESADRSIYWDLSGIGCKDFDRQSSTWLHKLHTSIVADVLLLRWRGCRCVRVSAYPFARIEDALLGPVRPVTTQKSQSRQQMIQRTRGQWPVP